MTAVTLAIQKFCAIITYDDNAADTTWTGRGRGEETTYEQEDLRRGPLQQAAHMKVRLLGPGYHHGNGGTGCGPLQQGAIPPPTL